MNDIQEQPERALERACNGLAMINCLLEAHAWLDLSDHGQRELAYHISEFVLTQVGDVKSVVDELEAS